MYNQNPTLNTETKLDKLDFNLDKIAPYIIKPFSLLKSIFQKSILGNHILSIHFDFALLVFVLF